MEQNSVNREPVAAKANPQNEQSDSGAVPPKIDKQSEVQSDAPGQNEKNGNRKPASRFEKITIIIGLVIAGGTGVVVGWQSFIARKTLIEIHDQSALTYNEQRPLVFVRNPRITVKVGSPLSASIDVYNFGETPVWVRANIHAEVGPRVIETFRGVLKWERNEAYFAPDTIGSEKMLLYSHEDHSNFPVIVATSLLTAQNVADIQSGAIQAAIYGRLFFTDLNYSAPVESNGYGEFNASFCFYLMKDGTVSGCPNIPTAYTNFLPN